MSDIKSYTERLEEVMKWKEYFSYKDVSRRLKAVGVTWGSSVPLVKKVLIERCHENEKVVAAAEDVVNAQKLLLSGSPVPIIQFPQLEQAA